MNKLTNEQKARVFALYLGCQIFDEYDNQHGRLISVGLDGCMFRRNTFHPRKYDEVKLLLKPLSAISDDDAIDICRVHYQFVGLITDVWSEEEVCEEGRKLIEEFIYGRKHRFDVALFQDLIQRGYSVPLFIAPNHPDNCKTAIELGLAIDSTKEVKP